ncbi:MAG: HAD-IIA family hydrolase [Clostridia bacterium]|nr:HAD-IIA family hydrolase [Clostridia bacterium]
MVDLHAVKVYLFDMDGTLNMGETPIEGAMDTLRYLDSHGKKVYFATNNSSKSQTAYVEKLRRMGYEAKQEQIITSGMATMHFLKKHFPGRSVYILGTELLKREFSEGGFDVRGVGEDADIMLLAFDTELTYEKLWHATNLIAAGKPYIATHPDFVCPSEKGDMPDAGALMACVEATVGKRPETIVGKPYAPMADFVFDYCGAAPKECAFVGDRLYTDIKFGLNNGMASVLVMTGETTEETLRDFDVRPDYKLDSVNELKKYC